MLVFMNSTEGPSARRTVPSWVEEREYTLCSAGGNFTFMESKREISPSAKGSDFHGRTEVPRSQVRKACGIRGLGKHLPRQGQDREAIRTGHKGYALIDGGRRLFGR